MTGRRQLDLALVVLWLEAVFAASALGWPVPVVAFFAFAAGERWASFWIRDVQR